MQAHARPTVLSAVAHALRRIVAFATPGVLRASITESGYQEALVTIKGRYRPDVIEVVQGVPVRLRFRRDEDEPCSERVIFAGIGIERRLPAFRETILDFTPEKAGTFLFTCEMGMYRGKLIVRPGILLGETS